MNSDPNSREFKQALDRWITREPDWKETVPIPDKMIGERWVRHEGALTRCTLHNTLFNEDEEPCEQCYNEVQG